jgi:hypothetical protein
VETPAGPDAPVLLLHWETLLGSLLDRTADFPRAHRHTFAARLEGIALDIHVWLVRARWSSRMQKRELLERANAELAVLRALLRLSVDRRLLARGPYEQLVRDLDEAGRMIGGWLRAVTQGHAELP